MEAIRYRGYTLEFNNLPAPNEQVVRCRAVHGRTPESPWGDYRMRRLTTFGMSHPESANRAKAAIDSEHILTPEPA